MTQIIEIETVGINIAEQSKALQIVDQQSYNKAVEMRVTIKDFLKKVDSVFDPMRTSAHVAWQLVCKQQKSVKEPVEKALASIDGGLRSFVAEQERKRREEEARLRQEELRRAEEERLKQAEELQQNGADEESVDAILEAPIITASVVAAPTYEKSSAVVMRDNYSARVTNLMSLVKHVAKNPHLINLLQPNQTALNLQAKALKETLQIPGVVIENNKIVASGRGA